MREPLLAAHGLEWRARGRRIVGPLELEVAAGECLTVVGPNGAGKTTLLRLLAAVLEPSRGGVAWRGQPYAELERRPLARRIAYVPQVRPARVPLTVEQLVLHGRYPHLRRGQLAPAAEDYRAIARAIERVGIEELRARPLDELSGGERQAAYIAAALAQEAELLILDEPTTHLDPRHQRDIAGLVTRLNREHRQTVVTATHDLHLAARISTRVLALKAGEILAAGPPAELLHPHTLGELFEAPFDLVETREQPLPVLDLG